MKKYSAGKLSGIREIAFDLDGTIYEGGRLIDGALDTVKALRAGGYRIIYFTNNSAKTRKDIYLKLKNFGLPVNMNRVYNSAYATALYLDAKKYRRVYCLGGNGLFKEIRSRGIKCINGTNAVPEAAVIGLDNGFNYMQLAEVLNVIKKYSCDIIACNVDRNFPSENGQLMPGCGPIVAAVESATDKKVSFIAGKPNDYMLSIICRTHNIKRKEILVVGDSFESDIAMGIKFGCKYVLVSAVEKNKYSIKKINHLTHILNNRSKV